MNAPTYKFNLDLLKTDASVMLTGKVGDTIRDAKITISEGGVPYRMTSEVTATLVARLPDGEIKQYTCDINDDVVTAQLENDLFESPGIVLCELVLHGEGDLRVATPSFEITVVGSLIDTSPKTVTYSFADNYSPTAIYIQTPDGTKYHGDPRTGSFEVNAGEVVKCYVSYSANDNRVVLNGMVVAGLGGGPAEYNLAVTGDATITADGSAAAYGTISITM